MIIYTADRLLHIWVELHHSAYENVLYFTHLTVYSFVLHVTSVL